MQAAGVFAVLAMLAGGWVWWWPVHPQRWLGLFGLALCGHAWVLAMEFAWSALSNQRINLKPEFRLWLRAWWAETRVAPRVFAWRQPFRSGAWPDLVSGESGLPCIVFVHGFVCNRGFWLPWMKLCHERRQPFLSVSLEPVLGDIDRYVDQIDAALSRAQALTGLAPVVICHSMGGLALRAWMVAHPGKATELAKVMTIASPHHGTELARFSRGGSAAQMRPDSDWLKHLAAREAEQRPDDCYSRFVCWYSTTDNIVFPALTATLPGADNREVAGAGHVDLAFQTRVMKESLAMVASGASSPRARTAS